MSDYRDPPRLKMIYGLIKVKTIPNKSSQKGSTINNPLRKPR